MFVLIRIHFTYLLSKLELELTRTRTRDKKINNKRKILK